MLQLFLSFAVWVGSFFGTNYEVWHAPAGGGELKRFSVATDRGVAEQVAAALRTAGGRAEVRAVGFARPGAGATAGGGGNPPKQPDPKNPVAKTPDPKSPTAQPPGGRPAELTVAQGQLTFDAEGQEGGPFHSRTPHVPSDNSGVTIGRGYDMKHRTKAQIKADLIAAGLSEADATAYANAAGLSGAAARKFIMDNKLPEITLAQQKALFELEYARKLAEVRRICEKADVVAKYGATDWGNLSPAIKTLLADLIYRGDYTGATREYVQPLVVANDVPGMAALMADRTRWASVPRARFEARRDYMNAAAAALAKKP